MEPTHTLEQLIKDVEYLKDRSAILDCIARHARAHDRFDVDMLTHAYHEDGVDEHGYAINPGPQYAEWANAIHAAGAELHTHNITTHTCDIDGDIAHCESYVIVALLNKDGASARMISGRYIDRLEKREGQWKIALRRSTVDLLISGDAKILNSPIFKDQGYTKGLRDKRDVSYQRPLDLNHTPERW
ncbi:nuclear transport factor 2 family protein [Aestuariicella hydrocarbonica]|uniref:Nuclear transport factor 2 family protein n=1 Tax=Pseudomaricurvus hydrocarbonicus TaxID=1470433 RepID=A0A9E5MK39_9GAMM|nr:nuclear transport factor 2 family protein [Aestuariicella hydrocarbonica]NHO65994.1 nuclear transport factor 2 family protein [Aestuariicella hydrocarbonica]